MGWLPPFCSKLSPTAERSAGYAPLITPDETYSQLGGSQDTYVVVTVVATVDTSNSGVNPFIAYQGDSRFQLIYRPNTPISRQAVSFVERRLRAVNENNLAAADLGEQASREQVDEQRLQITYLVEQRFYELVRAQRQLAVLAEAATRSRDQANYTQRLFEGGRATQADVYAARANRDNDEVQRLGQERVVELARSDLSTAIGLDPGSPLTVAEPQNMMSTPAQPPPVPDAISRALDNRPSLKAFASTAEQNRKLASASKGDYWPTVSLVGQWSRSTTETKPFFEAPGRNSLASAGLSLSWNLFNGLSTTANVRKAEIQVALAENDLVNGRRSVASDVEKAIAQLSTARAQARVAQEAEQTAKEGLRLARTRQEVGVGTQLEVRDAELKLTQAQLSVVGSLVDGREAESALRRAQGG